MYEKPSLGKVSKKNYSRQAHDALFAYIRGYIDSNPEDKEWKLPPELELSKQMNVSRATIRQALAELEAESVILRIHGKGTFINKNFRQHSPFIDCGEVIRNSGYTPSWEVISVRRIKAGDEIAALLECDPDQDVITADTVFYADGTPCIVCRDWFLDHGGSEEEIAADIEESFDTFLSSYTGEEGSFERARMRSLSAHEMSVLFDGKHWFSSESALWHESTLFGRSGHAICITHGFYNTAIVQLILNDRVMV